MTRRTALFALAMLLASERASLANGRFPASSMLVSRSGDASHLALRATYGLLLSSDGGSTWDWICERALGYGGNEDPSLVISQSAMVVGTFEGTTRSTDGGCHWSRDAAWPSSVVDLTTRPSVPDRVYALTSKYSTMGDAGALYGSSLFVSDDAGAHWTLRSTIDPTLLVDTVEVAPSDPKRAYISGVRSHGREIEGVLLRSDDDGAHWKEHRIPIARDDRGIFVAAVDPKNAELVYLRTSGLDASELFVTSDGGNTTHAILRSGQDPLRSHGGPLQGFALADDGQTIFAGGPKDGLFRASSKDDLFTHVSSTPIQCLTSVGTTLWNCAPTAAGYVLGASVDHGVTFSSRLTVGGMRGPLKCESPSAMDACGEDWAALQSLVAPEKQNDASSANVAAVSSASSAATASASSTSEKPSRFGCTIASKNRSIERSSTFGMLVFGLLGLARKRRVRD